jgi:signal transduction histidine kinase
MSPEVQKRIFVPFFTTKANVGTGIGLWVTKSLIEQQGGYLRFRSRQGDCSGTVMSLYLPSSPQVIAEPVATAA